jgi:hypothetical protein
MEMSDKQLAELLPQEARERLMALPGVVGCGLCSIQLPSGKWVNGVAIFLQKADDETARAVREIVSDEVPIRIDVIGRVVAG